MNGVWCLSLSRLKCSGVNWLLRPPSPDIICYWVVSMILHVLLSGFLRPSVLVHVQLFSNVNLFLWVKLLFIAVNCTTKWPKLSRLFVWYLPWLDQSFCLWIHFDSCSSTQKCLLLFLCAFVRKQGLNFQDPLWPNSPVWPKLIRAWEVSRVIES